MKIQGLTLALVVLAALAGCPQSTQNFCVDSANAACKLQFNCCTAVERAAFFGAIASQIGPYHDEAGCVEAFNRQCAQNSQATDEGIAAGRLAFDADRAAKCLETRRVAADTCDSNAFFNPNDNCAGLITGLVADGDACTDDSDCAEVASTCDIETTTDSGDFIVTILGTCKGQGEEGEPCLPNSTCNGDLRCRQDPVSFELACFAPGGAGTACSADADCVGGLHCLQNANFVTVCAAPAGEGDACNQDADCEEGLQCLQNASFANVCSVPGGFGASCNSDDDCAGGRICAQDPDSFLQTCEEIASSGELCHGGTSQCEPGLDCRFDSDTADNRCYGGASGDPCNEFSAPRCAPGLFCRLDSFAGFDKCQPAITAGFDCDTSRPEQCVAPLRCIGLTNTCQTPTIPDAPCTTINNDVDSCDATHRCEFDNTAVDDICVPRLGAGSVCNENRDCTAGLFCDVFGAGCTALKAEGASCSDTFECGASLECRQNNNSTGLICRGLSAAGEGCTVLDDCQAGLDCRPDDNNTRNICRGISAVSQRCATQGDCAANLDCRFDDTNSAEICRPISVQGEVCVNVLDCTPGLECRFDSTVSNNTCQGDAVAGEPCSIDGDCSTALGLVCRFDSVDGRSECTALAAVGASCTSDGDCQTGLRCRDIAELDAVLVCTAQQDNGGPCLDNAECISGHCDLDGQFCNEEPPEIDFEVCDGL